MRFVLEALLFLSCTAAALHVDRVQGGDSVDQSPISRCGNGWWNQYKEQHDSVMERLSKGQPAAADKFVIYMAKEGMWKDPFAEWRLQGGMADRMTGIVSTFALALATNATFLIQMEGLNEFYDSSVSLIIKDYTEVVNAVSESAHFAYWDRLQLSSKTESQLYNDVNESRIVFVRAGRGRLHRYFDEDGPIGTRLKETGMQKAAAYKCLFDFLFKPTSAAKSQFAQELAKLHPAPFGRGFVDNFVAPLEPRCVMIQIRTGDKVITSESGSDLSDEERRRLIKKYQGAFQCAANAEKNYSGDMLWYLMTDSKHLRNAAQQEYGAEKVIAHFGKVDHFGDLSNAGMMSVLGEQWLGSMCDAFVVSGASGLGQQAAFRSIAWQRTYPSAPNIFYIDADGQGCRARGPEEAMQNWSGA